MRADGSSQPAGKSAPSQTVVTGHPLTTVNTRGHLGALSNGWTKLFVRPQPAAPESLPLQNPGTNAAPHPGVFLAKPYSCLIIVPGPGPDDKCVLSPGMKHERMPLVSPELRLLPYYERAEK